MSETTTQLAPAPDPFIAFARKHRATLLEAGRSEESVQSAIKEIGEKCGYDCDYGVVAVEKWSPAGGAQSFSDYDSYLEAARAEGYVYEQTARFKDIADNIFSSGLTLSAKLDKLVSAARELRGRLAPAQVEGAAQTGYMESRMKGQSGPLAEVAGSPPSPDLYRAALSGTFTTYKDGDRTRWLTIHTNTIKDRDGQSFAIDAHKSYEQLVDTTGEFPTLRVWHLPGTDFGKADLVTVTDDGFVMASGLIDAGKEGYLENLKELSDAGIEMGCSHGFKYAKGDLVDGVFNRYKTFEISVLPLARAANEFTLFATKEAPMDATKRSIIEKVIGAEELVRIEKSLQDVAAAAKESGMSEADQLVALKEMLTAPFPDPEIVAAKADEAPAAVPSGDAAAPAFDATAITAAITAGIDAALAPMREQLAGLGTQVKELGLSDDEKLAAKMSRARNTAMADTLTPTTDPSNVARSNERILQIVEKDKEGAALPAHLSGMKEHLASIGLLSAAN